MIFGSTIPKRNGSPSLKRGCRVLRDGVPKPLGTLEARPFLLERGDRI